MSKKNTKKVFNFGDPEFNKKLSVYYSWLTPIVFFLIAVLMVTTKAYLTAIVALLISAYFLPINVWRKNLPQFARVIIGLVLIILMFLSSYYYT